TFASARRTFRSDPGRTSQTTIESTFLLRRNPILLNRSLLKRALKFAILVALILGTVAGAYSQTKLLRFPDIYGDRVVFTYASDLWIAPASGGSAIRLT